MVGSRLAATWWCNGGGSKRLSGRESGSMFELVEPDRKRSVIEEESESARKRSTKEASERTLE